jgi:hypothetical protein
VDAGQIVTVSNSNPAASSGFIDLRGNGMKVENLSSERLLRLAEASGRSQIRKANNNGCGLMLSMPEMIPFPFL